MKIEKTILVSLIAGMTLFSFPVSAQQASGQVTENNSVSNDPIIELLDSLVMLNNVIRFNNTIPQVTVDKDNKDIPYYSDEIYAQRLAGMSSPIPLTFNEEVKKYIDLYAYKRRGLTSRMLGLSNLYFPLYEEILDKEGLPLEFKYLSVVESALNPIAVSKMGATGLWQFMFNTGKMYDLKINSYIDERRDPIKSTHAACRYFKDMYAIYGDWLLVIASYNCGPGNVNKAIRRAGGKTDFWEIAKYLPAETRGYVPAFIAVTYVMNHANEHNLFPVQPAFNYFEVDTIAVDKSISLKKIAAAVNLPLDVVSFLNPLYKKGIIPDMENSQVLRLPSSAIPAFLSAEAIIYEPASAPVVFAAASHGEIVTDEKVAIATGAFKIETKKVKKIYTVKSGDNLSSLSAKLKCSVPELKKWNKLNSTMIRKGQQLSYYSTVKIKTPVPAAQAPVENFTENVANSDTSVIAENATAEVTSDKKSDPGINSSEFIYHKVEKGDTLWNIAKRYEGVTVEQIMEMNRITNINSLVPGTRIKVKVNG